MKSFCINPATRTLNNVIKVFETLSGNIAELHCLGEFPTIINYWEGERIKYTFINRDAKKHKSCSLNFKTNQLKRTHKGIVKISAQYIPSPQASTSGTSDEVRYLTRSAVPPINTFSVLCCLRRRDKLWNQPLYHIMTFYVESQLRSAATLATLAELDPRYFISQEVTYHKQCIIKYMNWLRPRTDMILKKLMYERIAFAELLSYTKAKFDTEGDHFVF